MKRLSNGILAWSMSSSKYIQAAVQNVKDYVNITCPGQDLPKRAWGPFPSGCVPKLDMSAELNDKERRVILPIANQCIALVC
jgi:hypothetical protein